MPPLTVVPQSHPVVLGIANMRGKTIAIMDLAMAIGRPRLAIHATVRHHHGVQTARCRASWSTRWTASST